jgi:RNA polymerase sigma-70 factor, ECF subfamily
VGAQLRSRVKHDDRHEIDDATLDRARKGDVEAFRVIATCFQQPVFAYLWRMLGARGDRALVEDLVQDTFIRVHRGLARFDPAGRGALRTWIFTIATRIALNELRRARPSGERLDAAAHVAADTRDARLAVIVRDALERMTPDHRAVLVLREYHELDYAEIASVLEVDIGTVRSRLSRAREALRRALSEEP